MSRISAIQNYNILIVFLLTLHPGAIKVNWLKCTHIHTHRHITGAHTYTHVSLTFIERSLGDFGLAKAFPSNDVWDASIDRKVSRVACIKFPI